MKHSHTDMIMLAPMLYTPADRHDLHEVLSGRQVPGVCSIACCVEDAVRPENRKRAAIALRQTLERIGENSPPILVRPADADSFDWMLQNLPTGQIHGFILPKSSAASIHLWIEKSYGIYPIIPILETRDALDPVGRRELAQACAAHPSVIPGARIGANDLFALLGGLRRPVNRTVYETPVGRVIDGLLEAFSAHGVRLCAPVCDRINDLATLGRELQEDVHRGLFAKTAIHPRQVEVIWKSYKPDSHELADARQILDPGAPAVFSYNGNMLEPACHSEWAVRLLARDMLYHSARPRTDADAGGGYEDNPLLPLAGQQ